MVYHGHELCDSTSPGVCMRRIFQAIFGLALSLAISSPAWAGGKNPADYPLRVHIFSFNGHSHYRDQLLQYVDGEGRANLYENGEPRGFDFGYRCDQRLSVSMGYETYMARWKKQGKELEILLPVMGKPNAADACELGVVMKDTVYIRHNGLLNEEPAADFKEWMVKHQYDPEHGMNQPVRTSPEPSSSTPPPPGSPTTPPPAPQ
jgi:hypothetical protein